MGLLGPCSRTFPTVSGSDMEWLSTIDLSHVVSASVMMSTLSYPYLVGATLFVARAACSSITLW